MIITIKDGGNYMDNHQVFNSPFLTPVAVTDVFHKMDELDEVPGPFWLGVAVGTHRSHPRAKRCDQAKGRR